MDFALTESAASVVEWTALALALGYVLLSIRQAVAAWPLMIASSLLYGLLFVSARLYGQTALQLMFVAIAAWGWWQWRFGRKDDAPLAVSSLSPRARGLLLALWAVATLLAAPALARLTDAAAPWLDAFTTAGSVLAQVLTARKYREAWLGWIAINGLSVLLFAQQGLWPTALLYAVFAALSVARWRTWRSSPQAAAAPSMATARSKDAA
ncbi:MAG: nicotinamide riboside transporter PnuC [Betaproteobacteria bacterium]